VAWSARSCSCSSERLRKKSGAWPCLWKPRRGSLEPSSSRLKSRPSLQSSSSISAACLRSSSWVSREYRGFLERFGGCVGREQVCEVFQAAPACEQPVHGAVVQRGGQGVACSRACRDETREAAQVAAGLLSGEYHGQRFGDARVEAVAAAEDALLELRKVRLELRADRRLSQGAGVVGFGRRCEEGREVGFEAGARPSEAGQLLQLREEEVGLQLGGLHEDGHRACSGQLDGFEAAAARRQQTDGRVLQRRGRRSLEHLFELVWAEGVCLLVLGFEALAETGWVFARLGLQAESSGDFFERKALGAQQPAHEVARRRWLLPGVVAEHVFDQVC